MFKKRNVTKTKRIEKKFKNLNEIKTKGLFSTKKKGNVLNL
jgi:hypothetical protein